MYENLYQLSLLVESISLKSQEIKVKRSFFMWKYRHVISLDQEERPVPLN